MSVKMNVRELRTQTKRMLSTVERGEEVILTYRGTPRARVTAVKPSAVIDFKVSALFSLWRDEAPTEDVEGYVDDLRRSRY